jgi:ABC-2 type transport system ATP-binding protein
VRRDPAGVRARVGLVTDAPGLYEQMTAPAYLDFFGGVYGLPATARRKRIDELLAFFDLAAHRRERMAGFSKGMKQKVALARALLHQPVALFLDEPTSGLDPLAARAVRDLIRDLRGTNRSIVLCTHDLDEAERLADAVAIIQRGRIVASDTPAALRAGASPDTLVRIDFGAPYPGAVDILADLGIATLAPVAGANGARGATTIAYRTPRPREVNPVVVARLAATGAPIVAVNLETRTLEDVYAAAVGREAANAAAEERT